MATSVPKQTVKSMVAQAIRQVAEVKFYDKTATGLTPPTTSVIQEVFDPATGTEDFHRVGNKCFSISTGYKLTASLAAANTAGNQLRIILFVDRQSNGIAISSATAILQTDAFDSYYNADNIRERFTILDDRIVDMTAPCGVSGTLVVQPCSSNVYKKLKDCKQTFADADADPPSTNAIRCLVIARNTNGTYRLQFRTRFLDM